MTSQTQNPSVTFQEYNPREYLLMDIASSYGLDKEDWDVRLTWANNQLSELQRISLMDNVQLKASSMMQEAEEPAMFYAGIMAYKRVMEGKPIGFGISHDATASGIQLLSIMAGCEDSARVCNVIPSSNTADHREDAYTTLYGSMKTRVPEALVTNVTRAMAKDSIMTAFYGSKAVPKKHFGEGDMLTAFYDTLETETPGAWALNVYLQGLWVEYALGHAWVLPDNFHVIVKEMNQVTRTVQWGNQPTDVFAMKNVGTKRGLSLCPNVTHSVDAMVVREMQRRCSMTKQSQLQIMERKRTTAEDHEMVEVLWEHYQQSGFLSSRILEFLGDAHNDIIFSQPVRDLMDSLPSKAFELITIHDCFRCLPSYGNDLRRQYNQILYELAKSNILKFLVDQIAGSPQTIHKGDLIPSQILQSNYSIC